MRSLHRSLVPIACLLAVFATSAMAQPGRAGPRGRAVAMDLPRAGGPLERGIDASTIARPRGDLARGADPGRLPGLAGRILDGGIQRPDGVQFQPPAPPRVLEPLPPRVIGPHPPVLPQPPISTPPVHPNPPVCLPPPVCPPKCPPPSCPPPRCGTHVAIGIGISVVAVLESAPSLPVVVVSDGAQPYAMQFLQAGTYVFRRLVHVPERAETLVVPGATTTRLDTRGRKVEVPRGPDRVEIRVIPAHEAWQDEVVTLAEGAWIPVVALES
jgi:hypothetical protein